MFHSHNQFVPPMFLNLFVTNILLWLFLTRTGYYRIHEFDWLKSISVWFGRWKAVVSRTC